MDRITLAHDWFPPRYKSPFNVVQYSLRDTQNTPLSVSDYSQIVRRLALFLIRTRIQNEAGKCGVFGEWREGTVTPLPMNFYEVTTSEMQNEQDEVVLNYFVLCDQVITEAQTSKQSLIGIYSALVSEQFPMNANLAVAMGIRVQTARRRELIFRFTGPEGSLIFCSPPLPCNWESVEGSLQASGFATLQIGLNLRSMPFGRPGIYNAAVYCDGTLLGTYPLSVTPAQFRE